MKKGWTTIQAFTVFKMFFNLMLLINGFVFKIDIFFWIRISISLHIFFAKPMWILVINGFVWWIAMLVVIDYWMRLRWMWIHWIRQWLVIWRRMVVWICHLDFWNIIRFFSIWFYFFRCLLIILFEVKNKTKINYCHFTNEGQNESFILMVNFVMLKKYV